jgi:hypothetical protein
VKIRNLQRNQRVCLALEDGSKPLIMEGNAQILPSEQVPAAVIALFKQKYDWDITTDAQYTTVIEITINKTKGW